MIEPDEIERLGGDADAALAVVGAPGIAFGTKRTGPVVVEAHGKGTHGYMPTDVNMTSSFLAIGGRVAPRDLGTMRMIDIAPTVARYLGVA